MLHFKYISMVVSIVLMSFFLIGTESFAVTPEAGTPAASSPSQTKVLKVAGIVSKIQNDTLYLENGKRYGLKGVKIEYGKGKPVSRGKKMAEMVFINGVLKEVTIR